MKGSLSCFVNSVRRDLDPSVEFQQTDGEHEKGRIAASDGRGLLPQVSLGKKALVGGGRLRARVAAPTAADRRREKADAPLGSAQGTTKQTYADLDASVMNVNRKRREPRSLEGIGRGLQGIVPERAGRLDRGVLAACKAASHRCGLEGGLCPPGALCSPPPWDFLRHRATPIACLGAAAACSRSSQAAGAAIVSRSATRSSANRACAWAQEWWSPDAARSSDASSNRGCTGPSAVPTTSSPCAAAFSAAATWTPGLNGLETLAPKPKSDIVSYPLLLPCQPAVATEHRRAMNTWTCHYIELIIHARDIRGVYSVGSAEVSPVALRSLFHDTEDSPLFG